MADARFRGRLKLLGKALPERGGAQRERKRATPLLAALHLAHRREHPRRNRACPRADLFPLEHAHRAATRSQPPGEREADDAAADDRDIDAPLALTACAHLGRHPCPPRAAPSAPMTLRFDLKRTCDIASQL